MVNKSLVKIIKEIGLTSKHAVVYSALLAHPKATPLLLARETRLNRSSLYRYLEDLREKGLVELVLSEKSSRYAADPGNLQKYLASQETRIDRLKNEIPKLVEELKSAQQENEHTAEVKYYQGVEGLKQMLWNILSTKTEVVGLGYQDWNTSVGKSFAEKLRSEHIKRGIRSRELLNEIDDDYQYTSLGATYKQIYDHRAIDPTILEIKHDTYIYNDVFTYYYHYKNELFGVEIHNKEIAKTERQVFEVLWKMAGKEME